MSKSNTKISAKYRVVGVMSGTSLDGLDLALINFERKGGEWSFETVRTMTEAYPNNLSQKLSSATEMEAGDLNALDQELGQIIGESIKRNFKAVDQIDFIACHGHTIYHQPQKGITVQIGNAQTIHSISGLPIISDFRSLDVALGGNGAPLVPIGDQLLFTDFDCFLNLGGIANCTIYKDGHVEAYDIMPFNMVFNYLSKKLDQAYDENGQISRSGNMQLDFEEKLSKLDYYQKAHPKSLGYEDFQKDWLPLFDEEQSTIEDQLNTYSKHTAKMIGNELNKYASAKSKLLVTGGGAYHTYFIELLQKEFTGELIVPKAEIVEFKEAIIFGFLGVLRYENQVNCLSSVTGASKDSSSGVIMGF